LIFLYNLSIRLYILLIRIASLWNKKAELWLEGRKDLFGRLKKKISPDDRIIWVHCSSAGEFEQGKPIIEKLKLEYPSHRVLVSFFSPSGYEIAGKYPLADVITYLPADTKGNAKRFLEIVKPELVIFVKYEFWFHHLSEAAYRHIPVLLASAVFREDQMFFRSYGRFYRQILFLFRHIFAQDSYSLSLLNKYGITHASIGGDTRFDRVNFLAGQPIDLPVISHFVNGEKTIVAGSTWPQDENLIADAFGKLKAYKLILAPHEISPGHIDTLQNSFPGSIKYSQVKEIFEEEKTFKGIWSHINKEEKEALIQKLRAAQVLIIDNVGMLSRLYFFSTFCYIGGGFSKDGIHNVLEPAAFGKPVLFGPNFNKYREAKELIERGAAHSVGTADEFKEIVNRLDPGKEPGSVAGEKAKEYVLENGGASQKLVDFIQENRLLTN
jgi:3-deoxy-D-manno-octulosonic-acid transferase